jgi:hypothetical protein
VRHSSCRSAEPGPYQAPAFVTVPFCEASRRERAARTPSGHRASSPETGCPRSAIEGICLPSTPQQPHSQVEVSNRGTDMSSLVAAWALYLSTVGAIYTIAAKLPEFLSPHLFRGVADRIRTYDVSNNLASANATIRLFVDKVFRFRLITNRLFLPSLPRSAAVSVSLFLFFSLPVLYLSKNRTMVFSQDEHDSNVLLVLILWIVAFVADYLSFVKSRYLIERAYNENTASKTFVVIALDILGSAIIVYLILQLFLLVMFVLDPTSAEQRDFLDMGAVVREFLGHVVLFSLTISATAVTFCSVIISIIHILYFQLQKVDALRFGLFRVLNFEEKPHIAIAVIIIVGFTLVYWPIAIPIALAG